MDNDIRRLLFLAAILALAVGAPPPARVQGFSGAGSTFAHPILAKWGQVHATLQGEGGAYARDDRARPAVPAFSRR